MSNFWYDAEVRHDNLMERGLSPSMGDLLLAGIGEELRRIANALENK